MKNKTITIYELLGLIKDGKAPKRIENDGLIWELETDMEDYYNNARDIFLIDYMIGNYCNWLTCNVEILDETDDEFEEMVELYANYDFTPEMIVETINQLIRNQKKIIERLNGEDNE
jgi:hypothetical protein